LLWTPVFSLALLIQLALNPKMHQLWPISVRSNGHSLAFRVYNYFNQVSKELGLFLVVYLKFQATRVLS